MATAEVQHDPPLHPGPAGVGTGQPRKRRADRTQGRGVAAGVGQDIPEAHPAQRGQPLGAGAFGQVYRAAQVAQGCRQIVQFAQRETGGALRGSPHLGRYPGAGQHAPRQRDGGGRVALYRLERPLGQIHDSAAGRIRISHDGSSQPRV